MHRLSKAQEQAKGGAEAARGLRHLLGRAAHAALRWSLLEPCGLLCAEPHRPVPTGSSLPPRLPRVLCKAVGYQPWLPTLPCKLRRGQARELVSDEHDGLAAPAAGAEHHRTKRRSAWLISDTVCTFYSNPGVASVTVRGRVSGWGRVALLGANPSASAAQAVQHRSSAARSSLAVGRSSSS